MILTQKFLLNKMIQNFCIVALLILITFSACDRKNINKNTTIAIIADRTISKADFIRRAEYTIRPQYCRRNSNIDKKIILNSLIAEKMLALEADTQSSWQDSTHFRRFLLGRKEQAMRQMLYYNRMYKQVILDENKLNTVFHRAGRTYNFQYFTLPDAKTAKLVTQKLFKNIPFKDIFTEITGLDSIPQKKLTWNEPANDIILKALFVDSVHVGKVIGPVLNEDDYTFTIIKISGWQDRVAVSEQQQLQQFEDSKDWLKREEAVVLYEKYVKQLMKGKNIEFSPEPFYEFARTIAPLYLSMPELLQSMRMSKDFNKNKKAMDSLQTELDDFIRNDPDRPLFKIDNQIWTVGQLKKEMEIHPLVFRVKKLNQRNFTQQLKLAIVDLVRDKYITKDAYQHGYEKTPAVKAVVELWSDAYLANHQRNKYLAGLNISDKTDIEILEQHLNPYVDELQKKYSDQIDVNVALFDSIKLTRIDMFVLQNNVPYPIVVPPFPIVTTDNWLDYGKELE